MYDLFILFSLVNKKKTTTINFSIHLDHTFSSSIGHYLYIDPTGRAIGDDAQLASPSYKGSQPRCLNLWYYLHGDQQGTLQIQQKPDIGRAKTLWTKTNDQGNIWRRASIDIPPLLGMSTYKILIVGIVGAKATGGKTSFDFFLLYLIDFII